MEQSKNKVYDENFKKTMVELYESGQKVQDLVSEYGVSDAAIYTWIKRYGTVQGKTKELFIVIHKKYKKYITQCF